MKYDKNVAVRFEEEIDAIKYDISECYDDVKNGIMYFSVVKDCILKHFNNFKEIFDSVDNCSYSFYKVNDRLNEFKKVFDTLTSIFDCMSSIKNFDNDTNFYHYYKNTIMNLAIIVLQIESCFNYFNFN